MGDWLVTDIEINNDSQGIAYSAIIHSGTAIQRAQRVSKMQSDIKSWNVGNVVVGVPTKAHKETALKLDEIIKGLGR